MRGVGSARTPADTGADTSEASRDRGVTRKTLERKMQSVMASRAGVEAIGAVTEPCSARLRR